MENSENQNSSGIQNGVAYSLDFQGERLGTWFRDGEPGNRTYHVFDAAQNEIGHVGRYRYVEGIYMAMVRDHLKGVVAELIEGPGLVADVEKFLAESGGSSDG